MKALEFADMSKSFKWLRGIYSASVNDERCGLKFEIRQNPEKSKLGDKYIYRCTDTSNRLLFERKIDFATAVVVVNGWKGEPVIKEFANKA